MGNKEPEDILSFAINRVRKDLFKEIGSFPYTSGPRHLEIGSLVYAWAKLHNAWYYVQGREPEIPA